MTVLAPLPAARLAARTLVIIPPRPRLEPVPPAMRSSSAAPACARSIRRALGSLRGSAEYSTDLVGQNHQGVGVHQVGHEGTERVRCRRI